MNDTIDCPCGCVDARFAEFETIRSLDVDTTNGRYGEPSITRCPTCGQLWLHYQLEYEVYSRSGRWARGRIDAERAATIKPEESADYLAGLPSYIRGGSRFDGETKIVSGPMYLDP